MTIKSVLFDLDGTLLDRDRSIEKFIDIQYDRLNYYLSHIPKVDYATRFIKLDSNGHAWKDEVYRNLVIEFKIEGITWQDLLHDYETQFQVHCVPFPLLTEMLDTLKQQGYLLGIISNGRGEFQNRAISGLGIRDYFDAILISEIEGVRKPASAIFQRGIDRLGSSARHSVFVGDNPTADIIGAKQAGMRTIWKRNPHWLEAKQADAVINELDEIPALLERFSGC
ncbi:HAD family hydrolase [Chamaesiphon sp. GL140_3_metabinner_50]|uniref:HAD family hydrolase n=1 Tax=Chamaesiphon sp. GL140_3_metabinner_50 TaxID=2970812 RepID=UPI0025FE4FE1|nr:HAD family hydrolase [Chamaesiphon sp. GL140_3_metabinner_50]